MNIFELPKAIEELKTLDRECLTIIFLELMKSKKISYEDITQAYVEYLNMLRKGQSEAYRKLQNKIMTMWCGNKKDRDKNIKDIMHHLLDEGRINTTHEDIDKHK